MEGHFITVEGIDGSGKSTLVERLQEELNAYTTAEPSELWTGKQVRKALQEDTHPFTDFFLFMADRHHHIEEDIRPRLEDGEVVISDRFTDSSRAYQPIQLRDQFTDSLEPCTNWMEKVMNPWNIEPDLTIYLDVPVKTGLERCDEGEKYEKLGTLRRVKQNYEDINEAFSHRIEVVDAGQEPDKVFEDALEVVRDRLDV